MKRDSDHNPHDYSPPDKEAPIPSEPAPGINSASDLPEISDRPRKPRHKRVAETVVQAVKDGVGKVKAIAGETDTKQKKLSDNELARAVYAEDSRRMRAVKRYKRESGAVLSPAIRSVLRARGFAKVDASAIDAVLRVLQQSKSFAGYTVTKTGVIKIRRLGPGDKLAYTFGSTAMDIELWGARQWLAHPTVFDVIANLATVADVYDSLTDEGSPLYEAIKDAVDSVMASQEEATEEATGIKVEPVS